MDEAKAREIWQNVDLRAYTTEECAAADKWVRDYAMKQFRLYLRRCNIEAVTKDFLITMVRCHFGSTNVDELMTELNCYPDWITIKF